MIVIIFCLGLFLFIISAVGFIYTDTNDGPNTIRYGLAFILSFALTAIAAMTVLDITKEKKDLMEVIKKQDTEINQLLEVIGPGFKSIEGEYTLNDIVYVNADTTGVEFTLESGPFYWKGSYSKAFEVLEKLSIPDTGVFYFYTLQDILSKELKENN